MERNNALTEEEKASIKKSLHSLINDIFEEHKPESILYITIVLSELFPKIGPEKWYQQWREVGKKHNKEEVWEKIIEEFRNVYKYVEKNKEETLKVAKPILREEINALAIKDKEENTTIRMDLAQSKFTTKEELKYMMEKLNPSTRSL